MIQKKIAYIYFVNNTSSEPGIIKKLINQNDVIIKESLPIQCILISCSNKPDNFPESIIFIKLNSKNILLKQIQLQKTIKSTSKNFKKIIIRTPTFSPIFYYFLRNIPAKLIIEEHAKKLKELKTKNLNTYYWIQRLSYKLCNSIIDTKITVTNEIKDYEASFGFPKENIHVISNGIKTSNTQPVLFKPYLNGQLNLVFIASNFEPWHGLDRIINSINAYTGNIPINLHLIGNTTCSSQQMNNKIHKVINHGPIYNENKINQIFNQCNIAISSLCFFHNEIFEACVLKTREYILKGIPFIYGYNDTDIPIDVPFCLKFPNDNSIIPIETIINFAKNISKDPQNISKVSHNYALNYLSWKIKLSQLIKVI